MSSARSGYVCRPVLLFQRQKRWLVGVCWSVLAAGDAASDNKHLRRMFEYVSSSDWLRFFSPLLDRACYGHRQVPHGSVWCTEWDPLDPRRLAVGPSSCCPVSFFDAERQTFSKIAQVRTGNNHEANTPFASEFSDGFRVAESFSLV